MDVPDVRSILIDKLAQSRSVDRGALLVELETTGEIDSLEGLELAMEAEQLFGISISDEELSSAILRSIPGLTEHILSKLTSPAGVKGDGTP